MNLVIVYLLWYLYITDDLHVWFNIIPLRVSLEAIYLTKYTHLCTVDINLQPFFKLFQYICMDAMVCMSIHLIRYVYSH